MASSDVLCSYRLPFGHSFRSLPYERSEGGLSKRILCTVPPSASSFSLLYCLFSLKSCSSCLRLLSHLPSLPAFQPSFFQQRILRHMWPIQLVLLLFTECRIFLSSWSWGNTSSLLTRSVQVIFSIHLQHHISKLLYSCTRNQSVVTTDSSRGVIFPYLF